MTKAEPASRGHCLASHLKLDDRSSPVLPSSLDSAPASRPSPVRVFFPCTGLGRQQRGFETFTRECASALRDDDRLDVHVFAGGPADDVPARVLWNLPRDSAGAAWLARLHGHGTYFSEQVTFFLSFLPRLVLGKPDVIYFADLNLGNLCWHWRRFSGQRYRLVYYNGGLTTKPFTRADLVQQLTPEGLAEATSRGEDPARQIVLPHGVRVPPALPPSIRGAERLAFGLPSDRQIVLSVGLLDTSVKRMDYLVREMATMPVPRPFLCILGSESAETPGVRSLATECLGEGNFMIRTVAPADIGNFYRAADVFVLASVREGFGLVYVEALAHGLPIIAHDSPVTRYLLGRLAFLSDLQRPGAARTAMIDALDASTTNEQREARHASARARFGWDALRERYVAMLAGAASVPIDGRA